MSPEPREESSVSGNADTRERLESWKEIAAYLSRGVTTAQRWEVEEGLPIHRLPHAKKGSVFAFKDELDSWRATRAQAHSAGASLNEQSDAASIRGLEETLVWPRQRFVWPAVSMLGIALVIAIVWRRGGHAEPGRTDPRIEGSLAVRPLANDAAPEHGPSLSPDGTHVVYDWEVDGTIGLYIKSVDGGSPSPLPLRDSLRFAGSAYAKWSPRGDVIAFLASEGPHRYGLHVVPASGGPSRYLTATTGVGLCWHPDGSTIAFVDRDDAQEPLSIFTFAIQTGERRKLTSPPAGSFGDTYCSFSPDGSQIAMIRHSTVAASDVYIGAVTTARTVRRLTVDGPAMIGLAWSPDGESIVVGAPTGLWRIPASATGVAVPELIAGAEGSTQFPSFSLSGPSGAPSLAYEYMVNDVNIWRWDRQADGAERLSRLLASALWDDLPAFSPDGRRVAFVSNRTGKIQIWIADADGSHSRQITFRSHTSTTPQWSPDGERLAFASEIDGNWDIYVMRADGSESKRLTWDPSQDVNPSWSRDGRSIYFRSNRSGSNQLWKIRVDGGTPSRVTPVRGSQGFESPDGKRLYFVRHDNIPGLWSMPVDGGVETLVSTEVMEHLWAVVDAGIAFIVQASAASPQAAIKLLNFQSSTVSTLAVLPTTKAWTGFSITRDGRTALWCQTDTLLNDLMIIDAWTR